MIIHPQLHQSVTGFCCAKAANAFTVQAKDSTAKKYAKLVIGTPVYAALTISGTIESFFRTLVATLAKTVIFFVPKQCAKKIDEKVVNPLINHAHVTTYATTKSATLVVTRFMSKDRRINTGAAIYNGFSRAFDSKFMNGLRNIHINGFVQQKAPEAPKAAEAAKGFFARALNFLLQNNPAGHNIIT